jgi:hypothetical protein
MDDLTALWKGQKVLFLTLIDMSLTNLKGQNKDILTEFANLGAEVTFLNCFDPSILGSPALLSKFDVILLWTCAGYNFYFEEYTRFLRDVLIPFQRDHPEIRVVN